VIALVHTVEELRAELARRSRPIGLVPTMGALHAGHLSLVDAAETASATTVVSIFVNPLQFGRGEDLDAYPRDLNGDLAQLEPTAAQVVFAPAPAHFTPPERCTTVSVGGRLTTTLEGARRPGHFDGVTTIVAQLFAAAEPDLAFFGEKDYQQLLVVRRMVRDLRLRPRIVGCPIVREPDGLALSSRNAYLSAPQRRQAAALSATLFTAARRWDGDATRARASLRADLAGAPGIRLDYAEVVHPDTLEPLAGMVSGPARALVAAYVEGSGRATRLIDNLALEST
jgi:pantoate--beta-alanine ligase